MSRVYKTAKGKSIDIDRLKLSNETAIAVGNMKVNARGDLLGSRGQVSIGRNTRMDEVYSAPYSPNEPAQFAKTQLAMEESKAKELHDLVNNLTTQTPMEPIISNEGPAPAVRGSLAASFAKPATVNQQPMIDPRKPTGPTRI